MANTTTTQFQSASVMPCFYNVDEREMYYLIGKERGQGNPVWADFGGSKDFTDHRPSLTAIRELGEETIGALGKIEKNLKNSLKYTFKVQVNHHVTYITAMNHPKAHPQGNDGERINRIQARALRTEHAQLLKKPGLSHCQKEKTELAWLKASDLIASFHQNQQGKTCINNQFTAYTEPQDPQTAGSQSAAVGNVALRGCMAAALSKIAEQLGTGGFNTGFQHLHGQEKVLS